MSVIDDTLRTYFKKRLSDMKEEIGTREYNFKEKDIDKFCELISDTNPIYLNKDLGKIIPPSYIMNMTNVVFQQFFIKIGLDFFDKIMGVIHTRSDVNIFKPMPMSTKYRVKFDYEEPKEISGKMGNYFSVMFVITIMDAQNSVYAVDNHEFFFKMR
jgi:hypothetical protein